MLSSTLSLKWFLIIISTVSNLKNNCTKVCIDTQHTSYHIYKKYVAASRYVGLASYDTKC